MGGLPDAIGRVLVVDDGEDIGEAVGRMLRAWGVDMAVAGTAAGGWALHFQVPAPDLILIDVRLPDDSAFSVLVEAARLRRL